MTNRRLAAALFLVAALAGCGETATSSSSRQAGYAGQVQSPAIGADAPAAAPVASGAALSSGKGASIIVGTPPSADIERSVTAAYTVPAGNFLASFEGVIASGVAAGGYVISSTTQPDGGGRIVSGAVSLKIPAPRIADFLNGMPSTFTPSSINFASVDHTAAFVDVNARLGSAHAHLAALNARLARATSLNDITSLEQQVEMVQAEVDTDQGQLNVLTASVALATATIQLSERGAHVAVQPPAGAVAGGLSGGWSNAVQVTGAVLEGVVSALPLLVLGLVGWLVWRRLQRHGPAGRRPEPAE